MGSVHLKLCMTSLTALNWFYNIQNDNKNLPQNTIYLHCEHLYFYYFSRRMTSTVNRYPAQYPTQLLSHPPHISSELQSDNAPWNLIVLNLFFLLRHEQTLCSLEVKQKTNNSLLLKELTPARRHEILNWLHP